MKCNLSVIICTYNDRLDILKELLSALENNLEYVKDVQIIDMSTNTGIKKLCTQKNWITYHFFPQSKGLSDSRNKGLSVAKSDYVAFIDADAIPRSAWAKSILDSFSYHQKAAVIGGRIYPRWEVKPNAIVRKSNIAPDFFSMLDLGDKEKQVKKIIGANFAVNKAKLKMQFDTQLGRGKVGQLGGEETKLCEEVINKGYDVIYCPQAVVEHFVPKRKLTYKWLAYRAYYTGISRSLRQGGVSTYSKKRNLFDVIFVGLIICPYIYGYIKGRTTFAK